MKVIPETCRRD